MIKNAFSEHFPKSGNRTLEKCFTVEALKSGTQALERVLPGETHSESLGRLSKTSFGRGTFRENLLLLSKIARFHAHFNGPLAHPPRRVWCEYCQDDPFPLNYSSEFAFAKHFASG